MPIVVYANASSGTYPGHIAIGEEPSEEKASYFGYRFEPDVLPPEFRAGSKWRDYLFTHTVPGNIVDESDYVEILAQDSGGRYYIKRAECAGRLMTVLPQEEDRRPHALYSFNPDDFHSEATPCYNCVTWATKIGNALIIGFLVPVRQGRVKEIIHQLQLVEI